MRPPPAVNFVKKEPRQVGLTNNHDISNEKYNNHVSKERGGHIEDTITDFEDNLIDLIIALQNPDFELTKAMNLKGHSFQELINIFENFSDISNQSINNKEKFKQFLEDGNIKADSTDIEDRINILRRKGRSLINVGMAAKSISDINDALQQSAYYSSLNVSQLIGDLNQTQADLVSNLLRELTGKPNMSIEKIPTMTDEEKMMLRNSMRNKRITPTNVRYFFYHLFDQF